MVHVHLPEQPHWLVSYYRVGRLLHGSLVLFILESWLYGYMLLLSIESGSVFWIIFWTSFFLFSFVHIFLTIMDAWSRFQDYKKAKDLFYSYGLRPRLANRFIGSKCQRNAALQAARELGLEDDLKEYYQKKGVKWYHYIPYFMVMDPLFLIRRAFWRRTFMEKYYRPKYNFSNLQPQGVS
ncbi:hypothetical protein [Robiginitalea aurantiaca]|uniref:Uncharacterized protein n=1 Tax=Robiginitalea aurantiaca TaxID=3056915 RepID=A0ABT7WFY5_9FLAO|nr:hypothetical protein [Robiginitalea aurantiaca]MDM9631830.1 hypothetical protein [Robiginitalea aurantiaca]